MSIASEMRRLADSKQPELTLEEKHKLLQHIKAEATKGLYKTSVKCNGKHYSMVAYLTGIGFKVDQFLTVADDIDIICIQISWGKAI